MQQTFVRMLSIFDIDKNVLQAKRNTFQEMRYFGRYRNDCLALWTGANVFKLYRPQFTIYYRSWRKLTLKDKIHTTVYTASQWIVTYIYKLILVTIYPLL